jgi:serine/threonine protein kinase
MESEDVMIGDHIGAYRITGTLPNGAYSAVHRHQARKVQLVVATARDLVEYARTIQALPHPGIATIVDRGALADGRPWLAIDVPSGLALFELIARRPMPSVEVAALIYNVAGVLAFAHDHGVAHGNLTLHSIVLVTGRRDLPVCITDLGRSGNGDPKDDIHALGTIAYRAVSQLFPTAVTDSVPAAEPALAELIVRMLATDPAERPTAAEVRAAAAELIDVDDRVHVTARFAAPKWTPAPPINSDANPAVAGEIVTNSSKVAKPTG